MLESCVVYWEAVIPYTKIKHTHQALEKTME